MTKKEFHRYVGSMQQVAYIRPIEYQEGRSSQLKAFEIKSGDLHFHVTSDKCLDISDFSYKGMNMTFLAKTGLQGRNSYDTNGEESLRSIMGGLFFTCGLESICAPCTIDGKDYPMHGDCVRLQRNMFLQMLFLTETIIGLQLAGKLGKQNYLEKIWCCAGKSRLAY